VAHVDDILKEFGEYVEVSAPETKKSKTKKAADLGQLPLMVPNESDIECESKKVVDASPAGIVIRACVRACSMDDLLEQTGFDSPTLQGLLFDLQMEGKVKQNFMGMWEKL
jgi:predicted Rossmann fold nucleotide-binding protein DprA/Smf involved in DNA uptake